MKKIIYTSIVLAIPMISFAQSNVSSTTDTTKKHNAPASAVEAAGTKGGVIQGLGYTQPQSAAEQMRSGAQPATTTTNNGTTTKQPASAVEQDQQARQNSTTPH